MSYSARPVARQPRSRTLLPSAREVFAARLTHTEQRTDKHGRTRKVTVTDPWPRDWNRATVLARVVALDALR